MKRKLRSFWTDEELVQVYDHPYDHTLWPEHKARISQTVALIREWAETSGPWKDVLDLTCGDAAIPHALRDLIQSMTLGDYVKTPHTTVIGKIQDTLPRIISAGHVYDLFICCETLEHVEDPELLMKQARQVARRAIFSTPVSETEVHGNQEHYWSWSARDVGDMLEEAGWLPWTPVTIFPQPFYTYQIWRCV